MEDIALASLPKDADDNEESSDSEDNFQVKRDEIKDRGEIAELRNGQVHNKTIVWKPRAPIPLLRTLSNGEVW